MWFFPQKIIVKEKCHVTINLHTTNESMKVAAGLLQIFGECQKKTCRLCYGLLYIIMNTQI